MNSKLNDTKKVYVIVPSYNESVIVKEVIIQLLKEQYSVVLIDDGSKKAQHTHVKDLPIHLLTHQQNLGQGAALETGTIYALGEGADYIVHFDADGQHNSSDITTMLNALIENKADIVFGSRFITKNTSMPFGKKLLLQFARIINFLFTGIMLTDAHNGLRALTAEAAKKIRITENRMAHASEILFHVKKQQLQFTEVPVNIKYTTYSKQKGQSAWNSIRIVFDLLIHKLLG